MTFFELLDETDQADVIQQAHNLTKNNRYHFKDYEACKERLAKERLASNQMQRSKSGVSFNSVNLSGNATMGAMVSGAPTISHSTIGSIVSPSTERTRSDNESDDKPAKRVKLMSPCSNQARLAETQSLVEAKQIGSEALDNEHWYKQALYRAQHDNKIKKAARYRRERDEARQHAERYRNERDKSRANEDNLREQLADAVKQLAAEKGRADHYESEFDRMCHHASRP